MTYTVSGNDPFDEILAEDAGENDDLIPEVDIPEPDPSEGNMDSDAVKLFVRLVVVFNVALFGVAVGPMFLYFEGDVQTGGALLGVGLLAGAYGLVRYWLFARDREETGD